MYQPTDKKIWQGRKDSLPNERFFQLVECVDLNKAILQKNTKPIFTIVGFCCDEGVKRNLGRPGAKQGPIALRQAFAKLPAHNMRAFTFYDVGDVICDSDDLEGAQLELANLITILLKNNIHPLVFGGGHEIAWGHYQGITKANSNNNIGNKNIGIINFDAHFDLRPLLPNNQGSSGTPFLQIAHECHSHNQPFNYMCIGIQKHANTQSLCQTANELGVNTILAEELHDRNQEKVFAKLDEFIERVDSIYLTLCLDVLAAAHAPGVSAPQPLGLNPWQLIPLLKHIASTQKVISFDIAELSPPHDHNDMTANLAATLLFEYLEAFIKLDC